jgi:hypothetical protein
MTSAPHLATLAAATLGIGWLMTIAGLQKSALEFKKRRRVCPSCGAPHRRAHLHLLPVTRATSCLRQELLRLLRRPPLELLRDAGRSPA